MVIKKEIWLNKQDLIQMICDKHGIVNDGDVEFTLNTVNSKLSDNNVFKSITVKGKCVEEEKTFGTVKIGNLNYRDEDFIMKPKDIQNPTCNQ